MGQVSELVDQLKRRMRAMEMTYDDLAKRLDVSESTVKRWFSQYSFDIERLDDICNAISADLSDLVSPKRKRLAVRYFNEQQEEELSVDDTLFSVFYLAVSGATVVDILKHYDISLPKLRTYLIKLDHLALLELHPGDRIEPLVNQSLRWIPGGLLYQKYGAYIRNDFMNSTFVGENEEDWVVSGRVSTASLQVIRRKLEATLTEFCDLMDLDQNLPKAETTNITFYAAQRPWHMPVLAHLRKTKKR